jgi:hypothetical protein
MKSLVLLGGVGVVLVSLSGCTTYTGDEQASADEINAGADPQSADDYAAKLHPDEATSTGGVALDIPGLKLAPSGNFADLVEVPPQVLPNKGTKDWVVDLSKITFLDGAQGRIGFSADSKITIAKPTLTIDQNIGPAAHIGKWRLNHLDAVLSGGTTMRAIVEIESPSDGSDTAQFCTGDPSDPSCLVLGKDPEFTVKVWDAPLTPVVFGVPVVITPTVNLNVGCHIETAVKGKARFGADYAFTFKKGFEFNFLNRYSKDPSRRPEGSTGGPEEWGPEHDNDFSGDKIFPGSGYFNAFPNEASSTGIKPIAEVSGKSIGVAECWVEPQVSVSLYNFVGGELDVKPWARGTAKLDPSATAPVSYMVVYGMKANAKAWVKLPFLPRFESPAFQLLDWGGGPDQTIKGEVTFKP